MRLNDLERQTLDRKKNSTIIEIKQRHLLALKLKTETFDRAVRIPAPAVPTARMQKQCGES